MDAEAYLDDCHSCEYASLHLVSLATLGTLHGSHFWIRPVPYLVPAYPAEPLAWNYPAGEKSLCVLMPSEPLRTLVCDKPLAGSHSQVWFDGGRRVSWGQATGAVHRYACQI